MVCLSLSVCPAGEVSGQRACLTWRDTTENVCPGDFQAEGTLGVNILVIGDMIKTSGVRRKGGCWHFVKAVYDCAGYLTRQVYPPDRKCDRNGPYLAETGILQPGDWIMHINMEYRQSEGIDHSAIFVRWTDEDAKNAYMLDYVGNDLCAQPGYKQHALSKVYCVMRAVPGKEGTAK